MQTSGNNSQTYIDNFATRVRLLILKLKECQQKQAELRNELNVKNEEIARLKNLLNESQEQYATLKNAKMLSIADNDVESAQKRINKLIRTVNQCLTMLKEEK